MLVNLCLFAVMALSHIVACEKAVVCYYGSWATYRSGQERFVVTDINPHLCTHLICAFAGLDAEGNVVLFNPNNNGRDNYRDFNGLKYQNMNLKTLLAVGGWNQGSAKFSTIAEDPSLRHNFIDSVLEMITKYVFDGLDIHWVYPKHDTNHGEVDVDNFATLFKELRSRFDEKGLLLTAAVSGINGSASRSYDVQGISKYLDLIHITAYGINADRDPITGNNAKKDEGDVNKIAEDIDPNSISRTTESPTVTPNDICKEEGYKVMPGDSSRFVYCIKDGAGDLTAKEFKCPANLIWDETVLGCNYPSIVVYGM